MRSLISVKAVWFASFTSCVRTSPVVVSQFTTRLLSPETHSALMSAYTWTLCDLPSLAAAEIA